jgi:cytochrome c553
VISLLHFPARNSRPRRAPLRRLAWLAVVLLPLATQAASPVLQDFGAALKCTPDVVRGNALYSRCAACHRADGSGSPDGLTPAIAAQHFRVVARQLVDYRHHQRWDPRMEHISDGQQMSSVQDIADLAAYISALPPTLVSPSGDGEYVAHGAQLYARACASCHGQSAQGLDQGGFPRLAGQHFEYLLRQMHDAIEERRPTFSPAHARLFVHFDRADFIGLSDYLSRLTPAPGSELTRP